MAPYLKTQQDGIKTRDIEKVMAEMEKAFKIHAAHNSHLGGVHLELTGDGTVPCRENIFLKVSLLILTLPIFRCDRVHRWLVQVRQSFDQVRKFLRPEIELHSKSRCCVPYCQTTQRVH